MPIRPALPADAHVLAEIYNQGIEERRATFETERRDAAAMLARIADAGRFPLLVATGPDGAVLGWAGLSRYRERDCYAGIAEFSIYLERQARGRGTGRRLLAALVDAARGQGYWKLVSRIFPDNLASRALCRGAGFREVGVYERHACLDGRWLDVVIVERLIEANFVPRPPAASSPSFQEIR